MKVAAVQHDIVWEDRAATLAHLAPQVARAAAGGAELVVLTEMFATGFSMRTHHTAEDLDGPIVAWLADRAAAHGILLAGSLALRPPTPEAEGPAGLPTNTFLLVGPDGVVARYDKLYPFSYAGEHERFRSGGDPVSVEVAGVRLGLSVCYDLRFADLYWDREPAVDVEVVVANWPASRRAHWRTLLDARAVENQTYVIGVNRVGDGGGTSYAGDSRIVDPAGEVLVAGSQVETILQAEVSAERVAEVRSRFPFRADRRDR
ncbi:MAG: nitrilase-related carbon-nitrogen hydrolase [Nitriliruptoraceae bacterium]